MKNRALFILIGLCLLALPIRAQINLLHEFAGGADGKWPEGSLITSGNLFYGMTRQGGASDMGVIFTMQADGSGFALLHEFAGGTDDGAYPYGSLILSDTTLYGMTRNGGDNGWGTIFKLQTDGSGYTLLHEFSGGAGDGKWPYGAMILSGSTLYGMTESGGDIDAGTVFMIETSGSGFTLLHKFSGGDADGLRPRGSLILSDSTLYGMTTLGGIDDFGTIFKMQTDGSDFFLLYHFGGPGDGAVPVSDLMISGTTLYGMTNTSADNKGTIFRIEADGTGFTLLHEFTGSTGDGAYPNGNLILSGSNLYGTTYYGGERNAGTIFKIQTDGTNFSLLYSFAGGIDDGEYPPENLILYESILYAMTLEGGDGNFGVVFSLPLLSSITVTSPNGDENWAIGENNDITWTSMGTVDNVNIDYSNDGGGNWISVVAGTENDGSFTWTIPDTLSSTCLVRVTSTASPAVTDSSDTVFAISAPFIAVTSPNGGEQWQRGITQTITWTSVGVTNVKIQLIKGTAVKSTITTSTPAAGGFYNWTIPASQTTGTNYKIRVVSKESSTVQDSSNASFTIFVPSITVTAPAAGASWQRGVVHTITWTGNGILDENVKIQLLKGTAVNSTIVATTSNDGSFNWPIPASQALAANYKIRIKTIDNLVTGNSGKFAITNSSGLTLQEPNDK